MSKSKTIIMDGSMGTFLLQHGVPMNSCFEELNLTRPSLIEEIHRSYLNAGAEVIVTNTFGANRPRLEAQGKGRKLEAINRTGVRLAKKVARHSPIFASVGPLGREAKKMTPSEMRRYFKEQAEALEKESPAGYLIETIPSLGEAEAATLAVREVSDRLVITLMTFPRGLNKTIVETVEVISQTLRAAGADILGANCGGVEGPEEVTTFLRALSLIDPGPLCARPAAGLPGSLVTPDEFAAWGFKLKKIGCSWIGGCCGTTPAYIRAVHEKLTQ